MFDFKEIRRLVKLLETSEIAEIEIEEQDNKIRLVKNSNGKFSVMRPVESVSVTASAPQEQAAEASAETLPKNIKIQKAPLVGIFYRAPALEPSDMSGAWRRNLPAQMGCQ
jgi:biotin carboxyl carrier protein